MMRDRVFKYEFYKQLAVAYKNAAKLMKCTAAIHVEASDDKIFWEQAFNKFRPNDNFHFITYTKTKNGNEATGCTTCLSYRHFLSKEFFVCIDSDYRYLLQEKNLDFHHAIFQTYTYSIENHLCYSKGVNDVFEAMGFKNDLFDFEYFLINYSKLLYKLFLYHLYSLERRDGIFTKDDFKLFIGIDKPKLNAEVMFDEIKKKVSSKLIELESIYSSINLGEIVLKYSILGLNKKNAYLYFRGHNLFDRVVLPIAREIRKKLELRYVESFPSNKKKHFFNENKDLKTYFMENIHWGAYPEIEKVEQDIQCFFANN